MQGLGLNPLNRYFPFLEKPRKFRYWCKRYGELAERVVRNAQDCPPPPNSIMASLLSIKDPTTGKPLNLEQLKSEVALLLVAGFETTAHSIAPARLLEWGDLGRLKSLDAAINESMRLLPVTSSGSGREARDDITVEGRVIPKGAVVMLPTYTIHRSKKVWGPDADEYKPERWLGESGHESGAARRPGYQPFSLGPRDCVGQSLAVLELRSVLATLIGHFRFVLAEEMGSFKEAEQAARQHITLKPMVPTPPGQPLRPGLMMHCHPRL
ncbi:cytochrome P450 [Dunaliella salina]|uniref:Cytochrome P450 n=1 Tax=Dunaliella salina TaxID=3046 RepID=A0ABQ7GNE2_DUNSA|nr:cytochrome P450 [Dunaliella salina]|eukprot:KAF5836140.1 cytochrome P450 [Dunaliella salina]